MYETESQPMAQRPLRCMETLTKTRLSGFKRERSEGWYLRGGSLMLGMDERTHQKLGPPPVRADCLKPVALPAHDCFRQLHRTRSDLCTRWQGFSLSVIFAGATWRNPDINGHRNR